MPGIPDPPWRRARTDTERADRRPLTRDAIIEAALKLLERDGLSGLSMRSLAKELGTGAASLYWHMGNKEELLQLLLDRIVGESRVPPAPDGAPWQEQVKQMLRETRRTLSARRDAAQLSMGRVPAGPNSLPVMERSLAVLTAAGLPPRAIAYAADMFALYVGGFAYEESLDVADADPAALGAYFASLPADRFPNLVHLSGALTEGSAEERFEFALELLVRGLEAMAAGDQPA
jgi:AcrR family transcriptional regulator